VSGKVCVLNYKEVLTTSLRLRIAYPAIFRYPLPEASEASESNLAKFSSRMQPYLTCASSDLKHNLD
jgi:hypothetical protein